MSEVSARVVAESGRPEDRFHLGKLLLMSLRDDPDFISQIDGGTGQSETCGSVLERSVRCAGAFRELGLRCGDIIVLIAPNHLDVAIPYYAGLYTGVAVAPVDRFLQINQLESIFMKDKPKIVFCQNERIKCVTTALENCHLDSVIVVFDDGNRNVDKTISFKEFLAKYGDGTTVKNFKATDFDPEMTTATLMTTSGSTGLPKQPILTHKNFVVAANHEWPMAKKYPRPTKMHLIVSPLQWLTAIVHFHLSAIMKYTRLQTSVDVDYDHACHLINTYKPTTAFLSPPYLANLLNLAADRCDFTCLETILVGGSSAAPELLTKMKNLSPKTLILQTYGTTEICSCAFTPDPDVRGSLGKPARHLEHRLIDVETNEDVVEPNVKGELWLKGPSVFKGYYKNEEETKLMLREDGWYKTGDIFYRDEHWNFFFVARIKLLLKYYQHYMSPAEIENVIRQHPRVQDVVVTGIPDPDCGDLLAACVVRRLGSTVTAQEIKTLVKDNLPDSRQLRGGVVFVDKLPLTATTKVNLMKVQELLVTLKRE
ncbi:luciferin 4-monooxygenase-like isoform X2 [Pectinophora gossypiella]|nr:luciferin 4-monooxygenase-like isoform X2 [Pectinophora gossypiella]